MDLVENTEMQKIHFLEDDYCQIELLPITDKDWANRMFNAIDRKIDTSNMKRPCDIQRLGIKQEEFAKSILKAFNQCQVFWDETYDHPCDSICAFGMSERVTVFLEDEHGVVSSLWMTLDVREMDDCEQAKKMLYVISGIAPLVLVDWGWRCAILLKDTDKLSEYLYKRLKVFNNVKYL